MNFIHLKCSHFLVPTFGILALSLLTPRIASAGTKRLSSTSGATTSWNTGSNWSGSIVPAATDDVVFDYANQTTPTTTVVGLDANQSANSLSFGSSSGTALGAFELRANTTAGTAARTLTLGTSAQSGAGSITVDSSVTGTQSIGTSSGTNGVLTIGLATGVSGFTVVNNSTTQTLNLAAKLAEGATAGSTLSLNSAGGLIQLGGANSFTGATTIGNGSNATMVQLNSLTALGTAAGGTTVNAGSTLDINGLTLANAEALSISGAGVGGAGALESSTGSGTYVGAITLAADATINSAGVTGTNTLTLKGGVANGGHLLTITGSGDTLITVAAGLLTGTGGLIKSGPGTLTFNNASTYSGETDITGGVITMTSTGLALQNSTLNYTVANGGTFNFGTRTTATLGGLQGDKALALANTSSAAVALSVGNNNSSTAYSGALSGLGSLIKIGTGTLTLSGPNTYTGATTVSAGTLVAGVSNVGTTSGAFGPTNGTTGLVTLGDANTATNGSSPTLLINGAFTVANPITVANQSTSGTYTIGGSTANSSTFSGVETLNQSLSVTQVASGTTNLTGNITSGVSGTQTLKFNNVGAVSQGSASVIGAGSGTIAVKQTGTGITTLSGANTYSGGTTVTAGTLVVKNASGSATGSGALSVGAGATLAGTGTSSGTSFSISGTGSGSNAAKVLVGQAAGGDNSLGKTMTLLGSTGTQAAPTSSISNANLVFNLNASQPGGTGLSDTTPGASNQLVVGATNIGFANSVNLTLNLQNEPAIVGANTPYVLIAGTGLGTTAATSQYTGLTFGASSGTYGADGVTTIITGITGGSLGLTFGSTIDNTYYGTNSYFVLYQNTGIDDIEVEVVPEPSTWAMMIGGLSVLIFWQRRKNKLG